MIAFDYGATLRISDGSQALRELVKLFNELGVPVCVISAICQPAGGHWERTIFDEIRQLTSADETPLRFDAVRFVYYPDHPTAADMVQAGRDKAKQMEQLGATLIFDDSHDVCLGVRLEGRLAVRHVPEVLP